MDQYIYTGIAKPLLYMRAILISLEMCNPMTTGRQMYGEADGAINIL